MSFYDEFYPAAETSEAHAAFCRRVYGIDLAQHGMLDMRQVDLLLEKVTLREGMRVLELGCGSGRLAEHLAEHTGVEVTGIDLSANAIAVAEHRAVQRHLARERAAGRPPDWRSLAEQQAELPDRLRFVYADMALYDYPDATYDLVLAVDSLAFVRDLSALLTRLAPTLRPRGKLAAFHSVWAGDDESDAALSPNSNRLGRALMSAGWQYRVCDLRDAEISHWQRKYEVLLAMADEFTAEGNGYIYDRRLVEAEYHQRYVKSGRIGRFLYVAQPTGV